MRVARNGPIYLIEIKSKNLIPYFEYIFYNMEYRGWSTVKTSLLIDDSVFNAAKKEASATGKTVSEVISFWARIGREQWLKREAVKTKDFRPVDLGTPLMDISSRRNWQEALEGDLSGDLKQLRASETEDDRD